MSDQTKTQVLESIASIAVCPLCKRKERMSGIIYGRCAGEPAMRTERCDYKFHDLMESLYKMNEE